MSIRSLSEIRNPNCKLCGLCETAEYVCLTGYGNTKAKIVLVGEAPGHREDESGRPFVGRAGKVLDVILKGLGLDRDSIYITNAVHCRPPDNRTPKMDEIRACRKYLMKEIKKINPGVVITLGNIALKAIMDSNNYSIAKERGRVLEIPEIKIPIIPTYHPAAALRKQYFAKLIYQDIAQGLNSLKSSSKNGQFPCQIGRIRHYRTLSEENHLRIIERLIEAEKAVVDVETTGLDMWDKKQELICVGFTIKKGRSWVIFNEGKSSRKIIKNIIAKKKLLIGHNIKFDLQWLNRYKITSEAKLFDTMVAKHLLDENYPDKSLKHLVRVDLPELGDSLDISEAKKDKKLKEGLSPSKKEWTNYCGGDTDATYRLYLKYKRELKKQNLMKLMKFEMRNLRVLFHMETNGFQIDQVVLKSMKKDYEDKIEKTRNEIKRILGDINFESHKQLSEVLYEKRRLPVFKRTPPPANKPSCDEETLLKLVSSKEVSKENKVALNSLLEYRGLEKLYSVYIKGLESNGLIKYDGKVHCNYKITGTVTGRLACKEPNLQNIPRTGDIKKMFTSSFEDGVLIQGDYSQAELRLLAHHSNDQALIAAFLAKRDIHREVAAKVFNKKYDDITEEERKFTKQVNFGIVYVIGALGLAAKLQCSPNRATKLIYDWFREFPDAKRWIERMKLQVVSKGYTTNIFGRRRRFFGTDPTKPEGREDQRQGVNAPIQGGAGDLTKWVGTRVHRELRKKGMETLVIANVHDCVILDAPKNEAKLAAKILRRVAINPPVKLRVPLEFDIKMGPNWKDLKEVSSGKESKEV